MMKQGRNHFVSTKYFIKYPSSKIVKIIKILIIPIIKWYS